MTQYPRNLILGGTGHAGSTWLFRLLSTHPEIAPSRIKHLGYFIGAEADSLTLERYLANFRYDPDRHRWTLEGTPAYLKHARVVAPAAARLLPDSTWVFILRQPSHRAYSAFRNHVQPEARFKGRSFRDFVRAGIDRFDLGSTENPASAGTGSFESRAAQVLHGGCYSQLLQPFLACFSTERILISFYDQIQKDPIGLVQRLAQFIEVDATGFDHAAVSVENKSRAYHSLGFHRYVGALNRRVEPILNRVPRLRDPLRKIYFRLNEAKGTTKSEEDNEALELLDQFYQPHNRSLANLLQCAPNVDSSPQWLSLKS